MILDLYTFLVYFEFMEEMKFEYVSLALYRVFDPQNNSNNIKYLLIVSVIHL